MPTVTGKIGNDAFIMTFADTTAACEECGHVHEISDAIRTRGEKTKRGYTTIKCKGCGVKLGVMDCPIARKISLQVYMTSKQLTAYWDSFKPADYNPSERNTRILNGFSLIDNG